MMLPPTVSQDLLPWGNESWERPDAIGRNGFLYITAIHFWQVEGKPYGYLQFSHTRGLTNSIQVKVGVDNFVEFCRRVVMTYGSPF